MKKTLKLKLQLISFIIIMITLPFSIAVAQDGDVIQVISTDIENDFPNRLIFHINVQSKKPITTIKLYYQLQGSISIHSQPIDFDSAKHVSTSFTWDTSKMTIAPSSPILYYWKIVDQDGNKLTTPEKLVYYDDIRFDWQELSSPELILRWYAGDKDFGSNIFNVAQQSLAQMKKETGGQLDFPIIILLYASDEDFSSWHYYVHDWAAGLAFPPLGVTTQIIPPSTKQIWIEDVIPHEIAHLFFFQIINGNSNHWPRWLDEGWAQYHEFSSNEAALERVAQAAQDGSILPLVLISGDFGSDLERVRLAYDEAYSVVYYLIETWGYDGLQKLIVNFRDGKRYREAVEEAFSVSWEEFEAGWITWVGVPTTPAPPPTSTPTMVYLKAPDGWPTPTKVQAAVSTKIPTKPMVTDTPNIIATIEVFSPTSQSSNSVNSSPLTNKYIVGIVGLFCLIALSIFVYRQTNIREK